MVILGLVVVCFLIVRLVPGDPAFAVGGTDATDAQRAQIRQQLGVDKPLPEQFTTYLSNLLHGDLGTSFHTQEPVSQVVRDRIRPSLQLAFIGLAIVFLTAIPGGLLAGVFSREGRHPKFDLSFTAVTSVLSSLPEFLTATFLAFIFAVWLNWLPVAADTSWAGVILPALAVSLASTAFLMRIVRTETMSVLATDYIRTARSKRLSSRRVYVRHVLPNAATAALSIGGLVFANIFGSAVIVENVFARPGLGTALVSSVLTRDYPTTQGLILVFGIIVVVVNALVDLVSALVDPRSMAKQA
jgi:peptide/nickel transport system permease protein